MLETDLTSFTSSVLISSPSKLSLKIPQLAVKCWNVSFQLCWQEFDIPRNRSQPVPLTWRWRMSSFFNSERSEHEGSTQGFPRPRRLVTPLFLGRINQIWQIHSLVEAQTSTDMGHLDTPCPLGSFEILSRYEEQPPGKSVWWFGITGNSWSLLWLFHRKKLSTVLFTLFSWLYHYLLLYFIFS